jgi:hypothetical protein
VADELLSTGNHGANQVDMLMAFAGALSIYLGYRLFCDSAYQKSRVRHLVSGALLAIFGLAILIADVRSVRTSAHRSHPVPGNLLRYSMPSHTKGIVRLCRYSQGEVETNNERDSSKAGSGV